MLNIKISSFQILNLKKFSKHNSVRYISELFICFLDYSSPVIRYNTKKRATHLPKRKDKFAELASKYKYLRINKFLFLSATLDPRKLELSRTRHISLFLEFISCLWLMNRKEFLEYAFLLSNLS